ncbi:MAG: hypothetical protein ACRDH6_02910 [Actinomycetota bacterium]
MGAKGTAFLFLYCWSGESPGEAVEWDIAMGLVDKYGPDWGPLDHGHKIQFFPKTGTTEGDRESFMIAFALKSGASKDQVGQTMMWHVDTPSGPASYFIVPAV